MKVSAFSIAHKGWKTGSFTANMHILDAFRGICVQNHISVTQLIFSLVYAVVVGDIKIRVNPLCRRYRPSQTIKACDLTAEFDTYRVELRAAGGISINPTHFKNTDV